MQLPHPPPPISSLRLCFLERKTYYFATTQWEMEVIFDLIFVGIAELLTPATF